MCEPMSEAQESAPTLVFTMPDNDGVLISYVSEVLKEVSRRSGLSCREVALPKERALVAVNEGMFAGVAMRVKGLESLYPNLTMINAPLMAAQHSLFAKNPKIIESVTDLQSLAEQARLNHYIVGYLFGSKKAEEELSALPAKNILYFHDPEKVFRLIDAGKVDVYLAGPAISNRFILKKNFPNTDIKELAVVSEFLLFPYLHRRHAAHIPTLENTLRQMTDDGTLKSIGQSIEM